MSKSGRVCKRCGGEQLEQRPVPEGDGTFVCLFCLNHLEISGFMLISDALNRPEPVVSFRERRRRRGQAQQ